jgi:hypothetical protein
MPRRRSAESVIVQCEFLIPMRRDSKLSDGDKHAITAWKWLNYSLWKEFRGFTVAPGLYKGFYEDPDDGSIVSDESAHYEIAIPQLRLDDLRALLQEACLIFQQKCIYLSVMGHVEFVRTRS